MMEERIILIIPAYNEQDSILNTILTIDRYNEHAYRKLDYIVINDGSKDNTERILVENAYLYPV